MKGKGKGKGKGSSGKFDQAEMKCEMVLCLEGGPAHELKWCPLPAHDMVSPVKSFPYCSHFCPQRSDTKRPRKLGLIAGTFEDGSFSIYAVPDPIDITPDNHDFSMPICGLFLCAISSNKS